MSGLSSETAEATAVASMLQLATNQEQIPQLPQGQTLQRMQDDEVELDNPSDSSLSELEDRAGSEAEGDDAGDEELSDVGVDEDEDEDEDDTGDADPQEEDDHMEGHVPEPEDEGDDTEAETERLHESPEKLRNARNVHHRAEDQLQPPIDNIDQTSEISALSESDTGGISPIDSPASSPRKRKRDELESDEEPDEETAESLRGVSRKLADHAADDDEDMDELDVEDKKARAKDLDDEASDIGQSSSKEPSPDREPSPKRIRKDDAEGSGADDGEAEAEAEVDGENKGEEDTGKKESALSSLRMMEKDFARLRDEMFADKMQQLNTELELLQRNPMDHTGYAAAIEAIDRRRDEQVRQARVSLDYKIKSLQQKSVAERCMAHSQYYQDVQSIRDECLRTAGEEWYCIQKARRQGDIDDEFEKRYHFVPDRSIQVSRQTAYNQEVSVLSGLQKHVGFPAAPEIEGASQVEVDDDLKKMGISSRTRPSIPIAAPISSFPRQMIPTADEHFLKQNPWADPQNALTTHTQILTPAITRQAPQGSASTIAASSVEQTPMSNQAQQAISRFPGQLDGSNDTPSRVTGSSTKQNGIGRSPHSSPLKPPLPSVPVQAGSG